MNLTSDGPHASSLCIHIAVPVQYKAILSTQPFYFHNLPYMSSPFRPPAALSPFFSLSPPPIPAATHPLHPLPRLPQTRTSSEPQFKVLSGDLIKSASTSYLMQNAALKSFVGSIKASKQRRDDKSTVLRPYDMAKARVNANKIFVYDPDSEAQHASTVGNDSINFVPCNPAQAKVLCSHDVDGHSSHSRNTTYASVPFEDAEDARREVARDSRSRWLGESFRTSSTTKSKHLMQANYFLYSPDTETQTLERECLQQQTLRNVARFKARKKPQLRTLPSLPPTDTKRAKKKTREEGVCAVCMCVRVCACFVTQGRLVMCVCACMRVRCGGGAAPTVVNSMRLTNNHESRRFFIVLIASFTIHLCIAASCYLILIYILPLGRKRNGQVPA